MNCPNCNTNLPDSASFCYSCGSSIRSNTFSYLPQGTPPWPLNDKAASYSSMGVIPMQTLQHAQAPISEMNVPTMATARDGHYISKDRPKRSARNILVALTVLALSILLGIGTSLAVLWSNGYLFTSTPNKQVHVPVPARSVAATPTTGATTNALPTPTSFQTIRNVGFGVSMKYPSGWVVTGPKQASTDDMFVDFVPQQQLGIELVVKRISGSTSAQYSSTTDANQANLTEFNAIPQVHNLQPTTASQPTIGGVKWDEQDASFNLDNGDVYHFVTIAVQHKKLYYTISFFTPQAVYNEAIQKYIQPMLDSFQFLS